MDKYNKEKYNQMFRDIRKEREAKAKQQAISKRKQQLQQRLAEKGVDWNKVEEDEAEAKPPEDHEFALGMISTGLDSPRLGLPEAHD